MELKERLENAIVSGEILEVKYFGGSNPGKPRNIAPIKIDGNKLIARCLQSNAVKSFSLEKISFSYEKDNYEVSTKVIEHLNLQTFSQISDFLNEYKQTLEKFGWYVKLEDSESLSLYSYFKNGKVRKTYDINISYEKFSTDEFYDINTDSFIIERKEKQKPWCVRAKGETTRSFSTLQNSIEIFLFFADKYAIKK